jgi:MtaA/CmuA family methyltransferase
MTSKERVLSVIRGEKPDRVPVFPLLMHWAARRAGLTYRQFATDGLALAQAQVSIFHNYSVDAITACSDAFRVSADLGTEMVFPEQTPPFAATPLIASRSDLNKLGRPDPTKGRMGDRVTAVKEIAKAVGEQCLVLGWVEMPFAECCSLCGVTNFMTMLYDDPALAHDLLRAATELSVDFALAQLEAGAPMIGAGDAAASLVSPALYREFALPYEKIVCDRIHERGGLVKMHICGNTTRLLQDMATAGADLYNVDHMVDIRLAAEVYGKAGKAFKGNLDPVADILQADARHCKDKAQGCIKVAEGTRYMLSAGCEIPADVTDEVFNAFCSSVVPS